ncbi:3-phosphoserine/phosphohydroxythreonine transaminase [Collinsella sp. AGMB00827]|uniref:Phosphoserine aminotransferase n=1 Tax=Collinsella ureilytica TaxID=2869515 RepID=A0ABS7MIK6_9ACTN|nr:3-phosphoserine/phosphohydroxythreonine transaminase [Collinsella urealyticum]
MARVRNFSAGPSALPEDVLKQVQSEILEYPGAGMSVLEMSHRGADFRAIFADAEASLRRIAQIPNTYRILFLQGGATLQFSAIPLNLLRCRAGYILTGNFSKKAYLEAQRYGEVDVLASGEADGFLSIPQLNQAALSEAGVDFTDLDYVHICENNTIYGTAFAELPDTGEAPLVADVSSCFLSAPFDIARYGLMYAGAQKNAGPAGVTVVIVREDLIQQGPAQAALCPTYLDYRLQAEHGSMYNTPNTFGIYLAGKVFSWIERQGGLDEMGKRNRKKAELLYTALDQSHLFTCPVEPTSRSRMNAIFTTGDPKLDAEFISAAAKRGLTGLRGHRMLGGMRASLYNAVSLEAVEELVSFIREFESLQSHSSKPSRSR